MPRPQVLLHSDHSPMSQLAQEREIERDRSLQSTGREHLTQKLAKPTYKEASELLWVIPSPEQCLAVCLRPSDSIKNVALFHILFTSD